MRRRWGYRHTEPAVFIAAWRHIHTLFHAERAYDVTWVWSVNVVDGQHISPVSPWWPGAAYVDWIGIDGHYFQQSLKFPDLFGEARPSAKAGSQARVHRRGRDRLARRHQEIMDLFGGARAHGIIGVMWFDVKRHNLRIEGDPAAISVFRRAVQRYVTPAGNKVPGQIPDATTVTNLEGATS